jgi:predicted ArsR family transcriptional regulator
MGNDTLKTSADDLYELVRSRKKISVEDAAKMLKLPLNTVHALVDFLVEEKIFGLEYKFTTPYIYISEDHPGKKLKFEKSAEKAFTTKEEFFAKAKAKSIPFEKIGDLWNKYLATNLQAIKEDFYRKARDKKAPEASIDQLWEKYMKYLR